MAYRLQITIEVVNDEGNRVTHRGIPTIWPGEAIMSDRILTEQYIRPDDAHNAMNLAWAFVNPIDNALSRHK